MESASITTPAQPPTPAGSSHEFAKLRPDAWSYRDLAPWLCAIGSGAMLALCFVPFDQAWLVWVALTPLICAVWFEFPAAKGVTRSGGESEAPGKARARKRRPFLLGYAAGIVYFTIVFHWLYTLAPLFKTPPLYGLSFLLSFILGLYVGLWAWFLSALPVKGERPFSSSARNLAIAALSASAWVGLEWMRGWVLSGFSWNALGVALHRDVVMIQTTEFFGVYGLSWLIAFCNVMAVIIVRRILDDLGPAFLKKIRWEFSATMLLVAANFAYGARCLLHERPAESVTLNVAVIQPNVEQQLKFKLESEDAILEDLKRLTAFAGALKPDLMVWPEAPAVRGMYADEKNYRAVMDIAEANSFGLLLGSLDYVINKDRPDEMDVYNAAFLLTDKGQSEQIYRKQHLVPFGEYLPLRPIMPGFVEKLVPGDLEAGKETTLLELQAPRMRIAGLVCFEDSLGDLTRRFVKQGAELLVNITNDGWFQHSVGAEQHLQEATFRGVENRRMLVRCTNTGMTGLVDSYGRVSRWIEPFKQGTANRRLLIPKEQKLTLYSRWGDWIAEFSTAIALCWLVTQGLLRRRKAVL